MAAAPELIRSYTDRVLALKAEQDEIAEQIKEIYAEAKSNGLDKTALGQIVARLRKWEKNPDRADEQALVVEAYWTAYHNAPASHACARGSDTEVVAQHRGRRPREATGQEQDCTDLSGDASVTRGSPSPALAEGQDGVSSAEPVANGEARQPSEVEGPALVSQANPDAEAKVREAAAVLDGQASNKCSRTSP